MKTFRLLLGFFFALLLFASGPGFRSRQQFDEHFQKHGNEFGKISQAQYLQLAQELRDAPAGGPILEARRGAVLTKFDKRKGYFGAYNADRTIRTLSGLSAPPSGATSQSRMSAASVSGPCRSAFAPSAANFGYREIPTTTA